MISLSAHRVAVVAGLILAVAGAGYLPAAQAAPSETYLIETGGSKHHYDHRDHVRHESRGDHKGYGHRKGYGHDKGKGYGHDKAKGYGHDKGKGYGHHKDHGYDGKGRYSRHPYRYDRPYRDHRYGRYEYGDRYDPLAGIFDYLFGYDRHDRDYDGRGRHRYH
jgi:hypothetical protein